MRRLAGKLNERSNEQRDMGKPPDRAMMVECTPLNQQREVHGMEAVETYRVHKFVGGVRKP
jgi:hypothetical protein